MRHRRPSTRLRAGNPEPLPTLDEIVRILRDHPLVELRERVKRAFVVGSVAGGTERPDSDIDILLEVAPKRGYTANQLAEKYHRKIQQHFVDHGIRGRADWVHPQWNGRRVDVWMTYDADHESLRPLGEVRPIVELQRRRTGNPPLMPGDPAWDPAWRIAVDDGEPDDPFRGVTFKVMRGKQRLGWVEVTPSEFVPGAWMVRHSHTIDDYRRRGLGQLLYMVALRLLGKLHPDWETSVSLAALHAWAAMRRRGLIVGEPFKGFENADVYRDDKYTDEIREQGLTRGKWSIDTVFPKGWKGILDQVYTLKDPSSVPLVEITRP